MRMTIKLGEKLLYVVCALFALGCIVLGIVSGDIAAAIWAFNALVWEVVALLYHTMTVRIDRELEIQETLYGPTLDRLSDEYKDTIAARDYEIAQLRKEVQGLQERKRQEDAADVEAAWLEETRRLRESGSQQLAAGATKKTRSGSSTRKRTRKDYTDEEKSRIAAELKSVGLEPGAES